VITKSAVKFALYYSGMAGIRRRREKCQRIWILRYHSISAAKDQNFRYLKPSIAVSAGVFESHIAFLSSRYTILSLDDLTAWINGAIEFRRPCVVITFDDGYRDNYRCAYPILKKYRATATFYVVTDAIGNAYPLWNSELAELVYRARQTQVTLDSIGPTRLDLSGPSAKKQSMQTLARMMRCATKERRREILREMREKLDADNDGFLDQVMMNWDELREMKRGGMCIGSHTVSHPLLTEIPEEEAREEIALSKAKLEAELGSPVLHFSYPNPGESAHVNGAVKRLVRQAGYLTARTSVKGAVEQHSDLFALRGVSTDDRCTHPALLAWMLNGKVERLRQSAANFKARTASHELQSGEQASGAAAQGRLP
jgi:peptidoglycan/xylan/chitin deacetylase (PgdA/CDA1 family)